MIKIVAKYDGVYFPPLLDLTIHNAPHKRSHPTVIEQYSAALKKVVKKAGCPIPIEHPIDLRVTFVDPQSPDLDHLHEALNMALDKKVLEDDGLIDKISFPGGGKEGGNVTLRRLFVHDVPRLQQS
jgi:Holliday junction resolvase RusA-like endonuclease